MSSMSVNFTAKVTLVKDKLTTSRAEQGFTDRNFDREIGLNNLPTGLTDVLTGIVPGLPDDLSGYLSGESGDLEEFTMRGMPSKNHSALSFKVWIIITKPTGIMSISQSPEYIPETTDPTYITFTGIDLSVDKNDMISVGFERTSTNGDNEYTFTGPATITIAEP